MQAWLVFAFGIAALASRPAAAGAEVTAAVVPAEATELATLLEAKLLELAGVTWLDRAEVDRVLAERELQALFAADAPGQRARLGQLLKADLLVLLREEPRADDPQRSIATLAVSETASGLRLVTGGAPREEDLEATLERLADVVKQGLARHGQEIVEVCAVPPFVSQDLGYRYDHLKAAYAGLIEQTVAARPGVLLVELAEAQALARELALAGQGETIRRRMPLYFLGEYRNTGQGDERTTSFTLRLLRGEKELGKTTKEQLPPDDAAAQVRRLAGRAIDRTLKRKSPAQEASPQVEARVLAQRGREHLDLGQAEEALRLLEASLLLEPKDLDVLHDAVVACEAINLRAFGLTGESWDARTRGVVAYRRGLDHLDSFVLHGGDITTYQATLAGLGSLSFGVTFAGNLHQSMHPEQPAEYNNLVADVLQHRLDVLGRVIRRGAAAGWGDVAASLAAPAGGRVPVDTYVAWLEELALDLGDASRAQGLVYAILEGARIAHPAGAGEDDWDRRHGELLARLQDSQDADVREGARQAAAYKQSLVTEVADLARRGEDDWQRAKRSRIKPLDIQVRLDNASQQPFAVKGCLPTVPGVDLWWGSGPWPCFMREKGRLEYISLEITDTLNYYFDGFSEGSGVSFDGRYVWSSISKQGRPPTLVVIDPQTGRSWELKEAIDPLFPDAGQLSDGGALCLSVTALGPGVACVAASYGQSWIGLATFDPERGGHVEVIHEARRKPTVDDPEEWRRTDGAFTPTRTCVLRSQDAPLEDTVVLIGRSAICPPFFGRPLVVRMRDRSVAPFPDPLPELESNVSTAITDSVYLIRAEPTADAPSRLEFMLVRRRAPEFAPETVLKGLPQNRTFRWVGNRLYAFGASGVMTAGPDDWKWDETKVILPWYQHSDFSQGGSPPAGALTLQRLLPSHHYGVIAVATNALFAIGDEDLAEAASEDGITAPPPDQPPGPNSKDIKQRFKGADDSHGKLTPSP